MLFDLLGRLDKRIINNNPQANYMAVKANRPENINKHILTVNICLWYTNINQCNNDIVIL